MIKIQNVSKSFDGFSLQNVNFEVPKGYIGGVFGTNGAGKTTLFHLILGLYRADDGHILVDGMDVAEKEEKVRSEIGYLLNEDLICNRATLLSNANKMGRFYSDYDSQLFESYCSKFRLDVNRKAINLSKGEQLKLQLAFALSHKPKLLLLDEPTANFDPDFRKEFMKLITEFVKDGEHSVLLATHNLEDLEQVGDYFLGLDKGRVNIAASRDELEDAYRMVEGENYKLRLLPERKVVYTELGKDVGKALVRHSSRDVYDKEVIVRIPTLQEIMYYTVKGTKKGEDHAEKIYTLL